MSVRSKTFQSRPESGLSESTHRVHSELMGTRSLSAEERAFIRSAAKFFEEPDTFTRMLGKAGAMAEHTLERLPKRMQAFTLRISHRAIQECLHWALKSVPEKSSAKRDRRAHFSQATAASQTNGFWHTCATGVTGGVSGFFGVATLLVELPVTTTLMMRSIAAIASDFGFDLRDPQTTLDCLFIFTLGGPDASDDGMNTSYLGSRMAFAGLMREAGAVLGAQGARQILNSLEKETAPIIVKLISEVATQFGERVSKKLLAQMTPVIGALGGAALNIAFSNYFSQAARFHFGLKRLEISHGEAIVKKAYQAKS